MAIYRESQGDDGASPSLGTRPCAMGYASQMLAKTLPAVFLDRDGTLMEEVHYCNDPARVQLFPDVPDALRRLKGAGFRNVIITNQSGIGRGLVTAEQFAAVQNRLIELIGPGVIDGTYHCPDLPGPNAHRRKPSPEMLFEASRDLDLDLARSWFIGDKATDVHCARAAGVRPILVLTGYGHAQDVGGAVFVAKDIPSAVEFMLKATS
jgi:D-glycero-D-manno-heptose 1,7-bisphosphate phosphatase